MNKGRQIQTVVKQIHDEVNLKRDFLCPTNKMHFTNEGKLELDSIGELHATDYLYGQVADHLGIPRVYLNKMIHDGSYELISQNYNHWLDKLNGSKRLIRTIDYTNNYTARAYLSDRFRPLDNWDLLEAIMPTIQEKQLEVRSSELTETKFYLKATLPMLQKEVKKGDIVEAGIVICNSEIGASSLRIEPLIYRLVCSNGMIMPTKLQKYHIGKRIGYDSPDIEHFFKDDTRKADDKAFFMFVRDLVAGSLTDDFFSSQVEMLQLASEQKIKKPVSEVVEVTRKKFSLSESTGGQILENIIRNGDLTKWGLANAVTEVANITNNYELSSELEAVGGKIIELSPKDWNIIAEN